MHPASNPSAPLAFSLQYSYNMYQEIPLVKMNLSENMPKVFGLYYVT